MEMKIRCGKLGCLEGGYKSKYSSWRNLNEHDKGQYET